MKPQNVDLRSGVLKVSPEGIIEWADQQAIHLLCESSAEIMPGNAISNYLALIGGKPLQEYFDNIVEASQYKLRGTSAQAEAKLKQQTVELAVWVDQCEDGLHYICHINPTISQSVPQKPHGDLLDIISFLQSEYVADRDAYYVFGLALDALLALTHSEYGFIGEILEDKDQQPYLKTHAITNIAWNSDTRSFYQQNAPVGMEFYNHQTLFGHTVTSGEAVIANSPDNHPKSGGRPEGHPPLNHYLGIPIYSGDNFVGMAGIANRPDGYSEEDIEQLRPLTNTLGMLIVGYQHEQIRRHTESKLRIKTHDLERASKIKSQFLASMSHELRTPLNSILGFSRRLQKTTSDQSDRSQSSLDAVVRNGEHLLAMINDLLDISQIEANVLTLNLEYKCLETSIDDAITAIAGMSSEFGVSIRNTSDSSSPINLMIDPVRVFQIILNLLSNAIKYGEGKDPDIWLDNLERNNREYRCIHVRDYGCGISQEEQKQLFKKYSRLGSKQDKIEGTGLGLALVSELVEMHNGWVEVKSTLGEGSQFSVGFPLSNESLE